MHHYVISGLVLQGFNDHVTDDHNMWSYIYYSIYLDQVDESDHNAIEKYVYSQVIANLKIAASRLSCTNTYVCVEKAIKEQATAN